MIAVYSGLELRISDTSIDPPEDAWRAEGVTLAPGERLVWTYDVTANDGAFLYGCSLKMQHTTGRRAIFGDAPYYIADGGCLVLP